MQTRQLGNTDLHLTTIGLGTWAIGGGDWAYGWGPQNDVESFAAIQRALDLGINWIDTAAAYGLGHAEEIVARALKGRRDKIIIATKCGLVWDQGSTEVYSRLKAASVRKEAETSLRRLSVDVIDLYQIHWPNPKNDIEEAWGAIADLIEEGKVRYGGLSNFNVAQIKRAQAIHPVASLQPPYSMIERGVEKDLLPYCAQQNIGVICYSPMQAGILTDNFTRERVTKIPNEDWRKTDKHFLEPELTANLKLVDGLRAIAQRHGRTTAQLAIAWVLRRSEMTAAIVGARRPAQIEETVAAADWQLSAEDIEEIEALLTERKQMLK